MITVVRDFRRLLTAHALESALTADSFAQLQRDFDAAAERYGRGGRLGFTNAKQVLEPVLRGVRGDSPLAAALEHDELQSWFNSIDTSATGMISWAMLGECIANAAAMRRHPPTFAVPTSLKWTGGAVDACLWVHSWRRMVVASPESHAVQMFSSQATPLAQLPGPQADAKGHTAPILALHFADGIGRLLSSSVDRTVAMWDHKRATFLRATELKAPVSSLHFDAATETIFCALLTGYITALNVQLKPIATTQQCHSDWVTAMTTTTQIRALYSGSRDHTICMWDVAELTLLRRLVGHQRAVTALAFAEGPQMLFSAGQGTELLMWNAVQTSTSPTQRIEGHEQPIVGLFADAVGPWVTTVDAACRVLVWHAATGALAHEFVPPSHSTKRHLALRAGCQNPVSRDLYLHGNGQFVIVPGKVASLRAPRLGPAVLSLLLDEASFLLLAVTNAAVFVFTALDGRLLRALDRPLGRHADNVDASHDATTGLVFLFAAGGRVAAFEPASKQCHADVCRMLLENASTRPLSRIISAADMCKVLVDVGVPVGSPDQVGKTALERAVTHGDAAVCKVLLNAGANANGSIHGTPLLHEAAGSGYTEVCRALMDAGADLDALDIDGVIALHRAAEFDRADVITTLAAAGAELEFPRGGKTPLHLAARRNRAAACAALLEAGADAQALHDGVAPLQFATRCGFATVCEAFVAGVKLRATVAAQREATGLALLVLQTRVNGAAAPPNVVVSVLAALRWAPC